MFMLLYIYFVQIGIIHKKNSHNSSSFRLVDFKSHPDLTGKSGIGGTASQTYFVACSRTTVDSIDTTIKIANFIDT